LQRANELSNANSASPSSISVRHGDAGEAVTSWENAIAKFNLHNFKEFRTNLGNMQYNNFIEFWVQLEIFR